MVAHLGPVARGHEHLHSASRPVRRHARRRPSRPAGAVAPLSSRAPGWRRGRRRRTTARSRGRGPGPLERRSPRPRGGCTAGCTRPRRQCRPARGRHRPCRPGGGRPRGHQVPHGPGVRRRVELDCMHLGVGHLVGDAQGDRPGTATEVHHHGVLAHFAGTVDRPAGQELGLRAGNEDPWPDLKLHVAERSDAGQVLERFAGSPSGDELLEGSLLLRADRPRPWAAGCGSSPGHGRAARRRRTPDWRRPTR